MIVLLLFQLGILIKNLVWLKGNFLNLHLKPSLMVETLLYPVLYSHGIMQNKS